MRKSQILVYVLVIVLALGLVVALTGCDTEVHEKTIYREVGVGSYQEQTVRWTKKDDCAFYILDKGGFCADGMNETEILEKLN